MLSLQKHGWKKFSMLNYLCNLLHRDETFLIDFLVETRERKQSFLLVSIFPRRLVRKGFSDMKLFV